MAFSPRMILSLCLCPLLAMLQSTSSRSLAASHVLSAYHKQWEGSSKTAAQCLNVGFAMRHRLEYQSVLVSEEYETCTTHSSTRRVKPNSDRGITGRTWRSNFWCLGFAHWILRRVDSGACWRINVSWDRNPIEFKVLMWLGDFTNRKTLCEAAT